VTAVAAAPASRGTSGRLAWLRERGMGASILVSTISSAFGVVLIATTAFIDAMLRANPYIGESKTLAFVLGFMTFLLVGVAIYVAGIVTANTFSTVVVGRTRRIALLRLVGATARSQRAEVANQGLVVGAIGAVLGLALGLVVAAAGSWAAIRLLDVGEVAFALVQPSLLLPVVAVALTTWVAAWAGSRRVLAVTPLQALGGTVETSMGQIARRTGRNATAIVLFVLGAALLAGGVLLGLVTPLGVVVAFFGGVLSFTGLALGATLVLPPALSLVGRLFGGGATARLAAANARRYPERSARMAIGVVMGVTLVTMFAVAIESVKSVIRAASGGELPPELTQVLDTFAAVMMGLVAVSAVIAAVGLVNLLTIGIVQRRRELGLLRALGVSNVQVRRMVLLEAAHLTITATLLGLVLGVVYGWAGAQSLLGTVPMSPDAASGATFVWPAIPLWPIVVIVAGTAILTLVAAVTPTRLATRVAPVEALADQG
jgi:putative ABC transport system permease protein